MKIYELLNEAMSSVLYHATTFGSAEATSRTTDQHGEYGEGSGKWYVDAADEVDE